jgi:hypothetical protein
MGCAIGIEDVREEIDQEIRETQKSVLVYNVYSGYL